MGKAAGDAAEGVGPSRCNEGARVARRTRNPPSCSRSPRRGPPPNTATPTPPYRFIAAFGFLAHGEEGRTGHSRFWSSGSKVFSSAPHHTKNRVAATSPRTPSTASLTQLEIINSSPLVKGSLARVTIPGMPGLSPCNGGYTGDWPGSVYAGQ